MTAVLKNAISWTASEVRFDNHIFFLTGVVGSGKSTISQTLSVKLQKEGRLGASFFFSRQSGERSTTSRFVPTIASQLAKAVPATAPFIKGALTSESQLVIPAAYTHTHTTLSVDDQLYSLVLTPFKAVWDCGGFPRERQPLVIVIDGLDECEETAKIPVFLNAIFHFFKKSPSIPLRFFIATRLVNQIVGTFSPEEAVRDDLSNYDCSHDMLTFLKASFSADILKRSRVIQAYTQEYHLAWPSPSDLLSLAKHANGSFRVADDMVQYILRPSADGLTPMERLPLALKIDVKLDGLYTRTLAQHDHLPHLTEIISTMTLLTAPLSVTSLAEFLGIPKFKVLHVLEKLQAIIRLPVNDVEPVTFSHQSLRDFLKDPERSAKFYVSPSNQLILSYRCFLRNLGCGPTSAPRERTPATVYSLTNVTTHWRSFLTECNANLVDELENFSHMLPLQRMPRHAFLSSLFIWELFHLNQSSLLSAHLLSYFFIEWTRQLELAVKQGPCSAIASWFILPIGQVIPCSSFFGKRSFDLSKDEFEAFRTNVQSASNVITEKVILISSLVLFSTERFQLSREPNFSQIVFQSVNDNPSITLSPAMTLAVRTPLTHEWCRCGSSIVVNSPFVGLVFNSNSGPGFPDSGGGWIYKA